MNLFSSFSDIDTIEKATDRLENILFYSMSPKIRNALNFCVVAHGGQVRKSGIPYAIHPILVSCIVASSLAVSNGLNNFRFDKSYELCDGFFGDTASFALISFV